MNTKLHSSSQPSTAPQISKSSFFGDVSRFVGNIRGAIVDGQLINTNMPVGMHEAIQESIELTFGKNSDEGGGHV